MTYFSSLAIARDPNYLWQEAEVRALIPTKLLPSDMCVLRLMLEIEASWEGYAVWPAQEMVWSSSMLITSRREVGVPMSGDSIKKKEVLFVLV